MFAKVAFPISGFKTFSYIIPKNLKENIQVGTRVEVPFGKRIVKGIVTELQLSVSFKGHLKEIASIFL